MALVMTLWCTVLLTLLALGYIQGRQAEWLAARELTGGVQARALAEAGIWRAAWELLLPPQQRAWQSDGRPRRLLLEGGEAIVRIHSEGGKISLNVASQTLLEGLWRAVGAPPSEATGLTQAILDWRDTDRERRPQGAEAPEYQSANRLPPRNGPFLATAELRQILGMRAELYQRAAGAVTAHGKQVGIEPEHAPRTALLALPGMTPETVDHYLRERLDHPTQARLLLPEQARPYLEAPVEHTLFIRSRAQHGESVREAQAVLRRLDDGKGFEILSWNELVPPRSLDAEWREPSPRPHLATNPMKQKLQALLRWWLNGLLLPLPTAWRPGAPRPRLLARLESKALHCAHINRHGATLEARRFEESGESADPPSSHDKTPANPLAWVRARQQQGLPLTLLLAPGQGLCTTLRLPSAAYANLAQVIRFEMDRQTPFKASEVCYDFRLAEEHELYLLVELALAPKRILEPALERMRAWELRPTTVDLDDGKGHGMGFT